MTRPCLRPALAALALAAAPAIALAHPAPGGHFHGFGDGFAHPFTGLDHLGAMLAVGIWSARDARRAWVAPLAFMACLLAGALASAGGLAVPAVEPMIAASLLAFGLLLVRRAPLAPPLGAALVGGFALFHGAAHGSELGGGAALAGMLLATGLLHLAASASASACNGAAPGGERGAGIALAAFGLSLLAA